MLEKDELKIAYGLREIKMALDENNIHVLLITDNFLKGKTIETRQSNVQLLDRVKHSNGKVCILSKLHESGERLDRMSGIAAILRFPCD